MQADAGWPGSYDVLKPPNNTSKLRYCVEKLEANSVLMVLIQSHITIKLKRLPKVSADYTQCGLCVYSSHGYCEYLECGF